MTEKATIYASEEIGHAQSRTDFVSGIQERGLSELAKGNPLPRITPGKNKETNKNILLEQEAER